MTDFTAVTNVGDNAWFHGLYVCPDIDTVTYTLAGVADEERGWGIEGDTFRTLGQLERLGTDDTWFKIGDLDFATHLFRTSLLKQGKTLTQVTAIISRALGLKGVNVLPVTDEHVETRILTREKGEMHLQEFWVKWKGELTPTDVVYSGAKEASVTPAVTKAVASADRIILCPGNPITSVMPMLAVSGFLQALRRSRARKVAVSPMVGRGAFSGPAAKLMAAKRLSPTSQGVASLYGDMIDAIVVDEMDADQKERIEKQGVSCIVSRTLMKTRADEERLAEVALRA
jgi:LPPG:FO 2-phospho-L-lactate transferase